MTVYSPVLKLNTFHSGKNNGVRAARYLGEAKIFYIFLGAAAILIFSYLFLIGSLVGNQAQISSLEEKIILLAGEKKTLEMETARLSSSQGLAARVSGLSLEGVGEVIYLPVIDKTMAAR